VKPGPLLLAAAVAAFLGIRFRRLSNEARVVLVVLTAGLVVYGVGLVHPPNLEKTIEDVGNALGTYTYVLVGVMAYLETGAFVGLVAPGEFTVVFGGVVAGQGKIDVVALLAIVWAAAVAGDVTSYMLGRRLGRGFLVRHGPRVKITEERLEQVEAFFQRHGGPTILIGRFIGLVRALAPFIAGASRMPFRRFIPYDVIAAGLWSATFVLLGYVFWRSFHEVIAIAKQGAFAFGTVVVVLVGTVVAVRHFRDPANRAALRRALERERRPVLRPLARAALAVEDRVLKPARRRLAGPARFLRARVSSGELGLAFTTLVAVALVGGFTFGAMLTAVDHGDRLQSDRTAFDVVDDLRTSALTSAAKIVTALGTTPATALVVLAALVFLASRRRWLEFIPLAAGTLLTYAAWGWVKDLEKRPRPPGALVDVSDFAFPSGHAANSVAYVAVAVALAHSVHRLAGRAGIIVAAVVLAAAIGLSRVYLHVHYMSDVLGGWGLGAALFSVCGCTALLVAAVRHNGRAV
jgi:membrane protein DedA with SNARE-associated domain/membrane-associated phospholipid phosphatase